MAFDVGKKALMNIDRVLAHSAFNSPLGEIPLILSVKRYRQVLDHGTHEFLHGGFHPAHPSVIAFLADARDTDFLILGDYWRRCSQPAG